MLKKVLNIDFEQIMKHKTKIRLALKEQVERVSDEKQYVFITI